MTESFVKESSEQSKTVNGRDLIFEGDEAEERGDHVVGADFACEGIDVLWLASSQVETSSSCKKRYGYFVNPIFERMTPVV
ncbi:unnamed protein product [Strongylus vulgaris]|uniref:Uncharacterized protein n=1 Tax=Strongylus vulgaris TaxID=40348 RepID=A0A3P7IW60_STRVU|nr:unnamed protein product [Strongylus vulgaris]